MKASRDFDVAVVGAGPAGCAAALVLARQGRRVVLFEKATLPRYKACGGGLAGRALRLLPEGAVLPAERVFTSIQLRLPGSGLGFLVTRAEPVVSMTMRADLDHRLSRMAEAAGARLYESCRVLDLRCGMDRIELDTAGGAFQSRFVVAADGVHSTIAKLAGWPALPRLCPALEYEVHLRDQDFQWFSQVARFDFGIPGGGYAWVFPKQAHLSVGLLDMGFRKENLRAALDSYLRSLGIAEAQRMDRHGWLIPVRPRQGPLGRGRILLTGDAAGLVDPVTAEGISHALLSGQKAAQAILDAAPEARAVAKTYQASLQKDLLPELRAGRFLANLLYHHPRLRGWIFRRSGQALCEFMTDVVMGRDSYRTALRQPWPYLKALGF
jgi:geranylgeranyl reductase family protein